MSFPDVPSDGLELGNLASSFAHAQLGPFEVHDVIGRGGMGIVFSGRHVVQRIPVAIKVITRNGAEQPRLRQVMHNEVRAVAGLSHPGIVRVLDYGDISEEAEVLTEGALRAGSPYFVMEMMAHSSLIDIVGRVSWRQAKTILLNLLDALAHSHARDVIHRDIKPGNILLDQWGGRVVPKLADFGLAFATRTPTDVSRSIGTPQYMAPEQIETPWRKHGAWSDLYSLGCLAFELLSGRKLFHAGSILEIFRLHLDGARKPLRSIVRVPDGFDSWLHRMIERNVLDRFQSAAEAAAALAGLDDDDVSDVRPPDCTPHDFAQLTPVLGSLSSGATSEAFEWPKAYPISMRLVGAGLGLFGLREMPLAGRRHELDLLRDSFEAVSRSGAQVVVIHGAHGAGKTKLVEAFLQRLTEIGAVEPMRAKHTASRSAEDGTSMMIARSLRAAGATRAEAGGIVRDSFHSEPQRFEWESVLALIEPTLAGSARETRGAFEFGSSAHRHEVVIRQMRRAAQRHPLVAIFDDVHFGEDSLDLVAHFLKTAADVPALLLLTVCDEELTAHPDAASVLNLIESLDAVQTIDLGPLDRVAHLNLVQDLLMLSGELAIAVADRTHGNPGFAIHLIDDWIENGHLEVGETGFVLGSDADVLGGIPRSARDLWHGTLRRVFAEYNEAEIMSLEIAAALGVSIWSDEWSGACRIAGVEPFWGGVGELVDRRLAKMTSTGWRFEHPVAMEFLRASAERSGRWTRWNAACASYLAAADLPETTEKLERLGEYWLGAGDFDKALAPLRASAASKLVRGDYRETERLATGIVQALQGAGGSARDIAGVHLIRARLYIGMGRSDEALRWATKALDAAKEHQWPDIELKATGFAAVAKQWLGAADGGKWLDRTLEMVDTAVDERFESEGVLMVLGYLCTSLGRFDDALRLQSLDHQLALAANDTRALASSAYQRCRTAVYMRDLTAALRAGTEARDRYAEMGHVPALSGTLSMLAEVYRLENSLKVAESTYRESIELARSVGLPAFVTQASLGMLLLGERKWDEAEELLLDAATEAAAAGRRRTEIGCRTGLLLCAVEQEHWSSAARLLPTIEEFCNKGSETEPDLADVLERAGDGYWRAGRMVDAKVLWQMAQKQWQTLDAADRADVVAAKLEALEDG